MKKLFSIFMTIVLLFSLSITCFASTNYTNQVPISIDNDGNTFNGIGYIDGYRLNSTGTLSEQIGSTATGFIPCTGFDVIRIKGVNWGELSDVGFRCYISLYDSNKNMLTSVSRESTYSWIELSYDENTGILTLCLKGNAYCNEISFIRINAYGNGSNMILTINEEILDEIIPEPTPPGGDSGSPDDDNTGDNTPNTEYVYIKENRPLFETPLSDYSVSEGILLLIFVVVVLNNVFKSHIRG